LEGFAAYLGDAHYTDTPTTNCYKLSVGGLLHAEQPLTSSPGSWGLQVTDIPDALKNDDTDHLNPEAIEDIGIICHYIL
jgi:hypothetical protein